MTSWKIVTDSSCDFRNIEGLPPQLSFETVPFNITIGNQTIVDNGQTETSTVIQILENGNHKSSTACPSPNSFAQAFEGAENVICFTISSQVSGSYNSANTAKEMVLEQNPQQKIHIYDSKSASTEMNLLVTKAIELIRLNQDFEEVIDNLQNYQKNIHINYLLFSVKNFVNNGRIPKIIGQMIGILDINLIGRRTSEGTIELAHKSKGKKRSFKALLSEMINNNFDGGHIDITYANNKSHAKEFLMYLAKKYPHITYDLHLATNLNAYYAEDGGFIISYHND